MEDSIDKGNMDSIDYKQLQARAQQNMHRFSEREILAAN